MNTGRFQPAANPSIVQTQAARAPGRAHVLVVGNEKGGSGKSTTAMHIVVSLLSDGARVATIDLDARQGTFTRYIENRAAYTRRRDIALPLPEHQSVVASGDPADEKGRFEAALEKVVPTFDYVVIDTPGSDTHLSRLAHTWADTLLTPLNDSFIDLDLLARVDPDTLKIVRPSIYAEAVWKQRQIRSEPAAVEGTGNVRGAAAMERSGNGLKASDGAIVDGERTRRELIEAYVALLRERHSLPTAARIAERAGCSRHTLHLHFADIAALSVAACDHAIEQSLSVPVGDKPRADRATLIRSAFQPDLGHILHSRHQYHWHTGYVPPQTVACPHLGAWMAKVLGPRNPVMPPFINIGQRLEGVGEQEELKAFTTAGFFGNEEQIVDHVLRLTGETLAQDMVLRCHTHRAGVQMADAHHDAAHHHQRGGCKAVLFGAEQRGDDHVPTGLELAIRLNRDAAAKVVQHEGLVGLGQAELPGEAGVLQRGLG